MHIVEYKLCSLISTSSVQFTGASKFSGTAHSQIQILGKIWARGALVFEVGYHPRKKIHIIRVVFQDQAMYVHTSFRGAKTCKIGKKGVFLGTVTHFGKDMME